MQGYISSLLVWRYFNHPKPNMVSLYSSEIHVAHSGKVLRPRFENDKASGFGFLRSICNIY